MKRRAFLGRLAALLPLPAFVKASSLWLPPERLWTPAVLTIDDLLRISASALAGNVIPYTMYVSPYVWGKLLEDVQELRRDPVTVAPETAELELYTQAGRIHVEPAPWIPTGKAYQLCGTTLGDEPETRCDATPPLSARSRLRAGLAQLGQPPAGT